MTQQLTDMRIDKVSLVDKGANERRFAVLKQDDNHETDERNLIQKFIDALDERFQPVPLEPVEKVTKTVDGKAYPAKDFAYVPDPESPSTWKLRLTSTPGGDPDPAIVGAAIAALGKGFRGNKVDIPADDRAAVIRKVRAAWKKAHPDAEADDIPNVIKSDDDEWVQAAVEWEAIEKARKVISTSGKVGGKRLADIKTAMTTLYAIVEDVEGPGWWTPPGDISKESDMDEKELTALIDTKVTEAVSKAVEGEAFTEAITKAVTAALPKPEPEPEKAEEAPEPAEDEVTLETVAEAVTELAKRMDGMGRGRRQSIDGQDTEPVKKSSLAGILN